MYQLTPNSPTTLSQTTVFQITLEEQTDTNQQWEIILPPGIHLVKSHYSVSEAKASTLIRTWNLQADALGTFTITCHYRKLCCSRKITHTIRYTVTITP